VAVVGISAGDWSALQFTIRHPERCRALVLLVPANYLPARTSIHGGAVARAIFKSDSLAWAALKLMPFTPGGIAEMMLGTDSTVLGAVESGEKARLRQILEHLLPVSWRDAGMQFDIQTAATHDP
jgi:2-hydroxy-6-oxonona-2,4-dienedioate hydrolase